MKSKSRTRRLKENMEKYASRNVKQTVDSSLAQLNSPTSMSMKNSFILKNSGPKFDQLYQLLKKREKASPKQNLDSSVQTIGSTNSPDKNKGFFDGVRPPARDGHSASLFGKFLVIFGGDRHHMPFNDLHYLDLTAEIDAKKFLFN